MEAQDTSRSPQRRLRWFALGVVVGVSIALAVPWLLRASYGLNRDDKWLVTQDTDLAEAWFFANPGEESPVKGTLLAGSVFTVNWLHGGAAYVRIDHVFDRKTLPEFARQLDAAGYSAAMKGKLE